MSVVVAVDLDRTLIYSARAAGLDAGRTAPAELLTVEFLNGRPQSFMTRTAAELLERLAAVTTLVPVTTRTVRQYQRVRLPIAARPFGVTTNGGRILIDGSADPAWSARVDRLAAEQDLRIDAATTELQDRIDPAWSSVIRVADGLFCYVVVDLAQLPTGWVASWREWCLARGWTVSHQGRKVYALPHWLTKESALAEVARRTGASRLFAAGDGALDAAMLELADIAVRPRHGELEEAGWRPAGVEVTRSSGIHAATEILARFLELTIGARAER